MKHFQVKICGNNTVENFKALAELKPDYVGFIFYAKSKRYVKDEAIFDHSIKAKKVGVFVNEPISSIIQKVNDFKLDVVQLHGDETPEYCKELILKKDEQLRKDKKFPNFKIWKAVGIKSKDDFKLLTSYQHVIDNFVFDTKTNDYGGSGQKFDWNLLTNYQLSTMFFLSGGIRLEDVKTLREIQHPCCLGFDINSGFESEPGIKNIDEVKQFIDRINNKN